MSNSIENYNPQVDAAKMRWQAAMVWGVSVFLAALWVFLILLAPIAEASNLTGVSSPIYTFFSYLCHQIPERSFHLENHSFAVCSRCFGVYFGLLLGFLFYPLFRRIEEIEPISRFWLFLALIPMGVDWTLGFFDIWENTHLSRFMTGLVLGTVCAIFIVPAVVELARLLSNKRQIKRLPT